jgi:hypothetical protein
MHNLHCQCNACGAKPAELYLHAACHMKSPTWTRLLTGEGILVVECSVCGKEVARYRVVQLADLKMK